MKRLALLLFTWPMAFVMGEGISTVEPKGMDLMQEQFFHLGLKAIIQNEQGDILVLKNANRENWDLPGGRLKPGELPLDALLREIEEETGITEVYQLQAHEIELTPIMIIPKHAGEERVRLLVWYHICLATDAHVVLSDEHAAYEWVPWNVARERIFPLGQSLKVHQAVLSRGFYDVAKEVAVLEEN